MTSSRNLLFYASVKDVEDFNRQKFYVEDVAILESMGFCVIRTNNFIDFIRRDYDVAFLYFYKWSLIPAIISRIRSKRIFCTGGIDELSPINMPNPLKRSIFQSSFFALYLLANKINVVSESDLVNINRIVGISILERRLRRIVAFPHSVRISNLNSSYHKIPHSFVTVCWMNSRADVLRKGLDKSLLFFAEYLKCYPNATFKILGKVGDGTTYLRSLEVFKLVERNTVFLDFVSEAVKLEVFSSSMFYLQFSRYEGFGLGALEANLCRCFILHSGSGGYLASKEIWGKTINLVGDCTASTDIGWLRSFSYESELRLFEDSFDSNFIKYTFQERLSNFYNIIVNG